MQCLPFLCTFSYAFYFVIHPFCCNFATEINLKQHIGMNIENAISSSVLLVVKELYGQDVPATMVQLRYTHTNIAQFSLLYK